MGSIRDILKSLRSWSRRLTFREDKVLSRFIARDVRRDILIVSVARIDEGIIRARVRTTNVLYLSKGLVPEPEFEPARELHIDEIWHWTGESWGGLPDGTSIVDRESGRRDTLLSMDEDEKVLDALRAARGRLSPVQIAELLDNLTGGELSQGAIVAYFKRAFPEIPLRTLLDAGAWHRVSGGAMSDDEFDRLLSPWLLPS